MARRFVEVGHEVAVSNSRGPDSLQELVSELGEHARAATVEEAARYGDIAVISVPFGRYRELPADALAGRTVIDTNNYYAGRDGLFEELANDATTSSELLQAHLTGARVVKAFNTMYWEHLRDDGRPSGDRDRIGIPISGDDPETKRLVAELIDQLGFDAVDAGALGEGGRKHQPGAPVYGADLRTEELPRQARSLMPRASRIRRACNLVCAFSVH